MASVPVLALLGLPEISLITDGPEQRVNYSRMLPTPDRVRDKQQRPPQTLRSFDDE